MDLTNSSSSALFKKSSGGSPSRMGLWQKPCSLPLNQLVARLRQLESFSGFTHLLLAFKTANGTAQSAERNAQRIRKLLLQTGKSPA